MAARLRETYKADVFPAMKEKFNYGNVNEVPKLVKVTINMGLGEAKDNAKIMESAVHEIALISGQKPVITKAKRVSDCKGVSKNSFDGRGNYSMGIKEQLIFPEINYDDVDTIKGMNIVFTTTAKTDEEAQALLELLGMPFEK